MSPNEHREGPEHINTAFSPGRAERQWEALEARMYGATSSRGARRRRVKAVGWGLGVAAVAAGLVLLWRVTSEEPPGAPAPEVAEVVVGASEHLVMATGSWTQALTLSDGSELAVEPHTQLHVLMDVPGAQVVELTHGAVVATVTHDPSRRFEVLAGAARVRVVGTRFRVECTGTEVTVEVTEGVVMLYAGDGRVLDLAAGSAVTVPFRPADPSARALALREATTARVTPPPPAPSEIEPAPAEVARVSPPRPEGGHRGERPGRDATTAADVFREASEAARAGRHREAESLYQQLLTRFPADPRANAAAFELGRLRLDYTANPRGALAPLSRVTRSPGPYQEDALVRLVEAYRRVGNTRACRQHRDEYLRRYPTGVHRVAISDACR